VFGLAKFLPLSEIALTTSAPGIQRRGFFPTRGSCVNEHTPRADAPYGARGSRLEAAIVAALRAARVRELTRVPVRPDDIVGL
jgi:hypothetical protein